MARKKQPLVKQQTYDIGQGATVTISYDENRYRPKMQHLDDVVIIGNHECAPRAAEPEFLPQYLNEPTALRRRARTPASNFPIGVDDPLYGAMRGDEQGNELPAEQPRRVITAEDMFRERTGGKIDLKPGELSSELGIVDEAHALAAAHEASSE